MLYLAKSCTITVNYIRRSTIPIVCFIVHRGVMFICPKFSQKNVLFNSQFNITTVTSIYVYMKYHIDMVSAMFMMCIS